MEYMEGQMQNLIEAGIASADLSGAIEATNMAWLAIARPIIKAMFGVEDALAPVNRARGDDPLGYVAYAKRSPASHDWGEAQRITERAVYHLRGLLDGIRDNALCDAYVTVDYDGAEDVIAEQEAFNDELARGVIGVDEAVKMIGDEA